MKLGNVADEITAAVRIASRHRLGMLLLLNPSAEITSGVVLDAIVSRELLVAIFVPEHVNRLHRGAVVIHGDRIARAGVPVTWATVVGHAAELAAGVAVSVDEDTGELWMVDQDRGSVRVCDTALAETFYTRWPAFRRSDRPVGG